MQYTGSRHRFLTMSSRLFRSPYSIRTSSWREFFDEESVPEPPMENFELHKAAEDGNSQKVRKLLSEGWLPDLLDSKDCTPLHYAASNAHFDVVDLLICFNCDVNAKNNDGLTPMWCAAYDIGIDTDSLRMIQLLIDAGADFIYHNSKGWTMLHHACFRGWLSLARYILKRDSSIINFVNCYGETPLMISMVSNHKEIVDLLLKYGADIKCDTSWKKYNYVYFATLNGWLDLVKYLINENCDHYLNGDVNVYYSDQTPLLLAAYRGRRDIVRFLLSSGADVMCRDMRRWNFIHYACREGWMDEVQTCIDEKNIDVRTQDGDTPLLVAAQYKKKDIVEFLIKAGGDDTLCNNEFCTLLHVASSQGWVDIVEKYAAEKADLNIQTYHGETPLYLACDAKKVDVVKLLLRAGADPNIPTNHGSTALFKYSKITPQSLEIWKLFISSGAYFNLCEYFIIFDDVFFKENIWCDVKLSTQVLINEFNNKHLPRVYELPESQILPRIQHLKVYDLSTAAEEIEKHVDNKIKAESFCNPIGNTPLVLKLLVVKSLTARWGY